MSPRPAVDVRDERGASAPRVIGLVVVLVGGLLMTGGVVRGLDGGGSPFVLMLLVMPVVLGIGFWHQHHRSKLARQWATSIGWTYVGSDPSLAMRWDGTPFDVGRSRRTREVVRGAFQGRAAVSFAYTYTTGSGKSQSTTTWHVLAIDLPAYLPTLELTPDGLGAKLAKGFGGQDLQLESEHFNQAWRVEAPMPRFAHDVLSPRLMERLLAPDATGLSIRVEGTSILCWTLGSPRYEDVARRLQVMGAIADAIPRFVWLDHGYDPAV